MNRFIIYLALFIVAICLDWNGGTGTKIVIYFQWWKLVLTVCIAQCIVKAWIDIFKEGKV